METWNRKCRELYRVFLIVNVHRFVPYVSSSFKSTENHRNRKGGQKEGWSTSRIRRATVTQPIKRERGTHTHTHTHTHKKQWRNVGYPPAEGRVENSQGDGSQQHQVIFSLAEQYRGREREPEEERESQRKREKRSTITHTTIRGTSIRLGDSVTFLCICSDMAWNCDLYLFFDHLFTVMAKLNFQQPLFQCHIKSF